ncbi:uncharacterized protein LOC130429738 [Triplophysa dalaica]|uniref:uncharacterized protein LOC130429738 n=1 Tax=Triplophysa dalaica TaxID=1582913 RepID=UPI0024DF512B|nr:uncharacterized protein LOC130429738 [Triplophysa dalaica]
MKILQLQIYLFIWCQASETLDQLTDLGQNVTINCDLDEGDIYWLLLKVPDPPVMILRTLSTTSLFFNTTFRQKYSVQNKTHLFINNITVNELGVYYCMKTDTPPKFSSGIRLQINETTESPNEEIRYKHQNHTEVKHIQQNQTLWQTLTLIFGLLSGALFIVIMGLLKVFVVGNKRFGECLQRNTDLQQTQVHEDPDQLQYAEVDFLKVRKKSRPRKADSTYAALNLPKLRTQQ